MTHQSLRVEQDSAAAIVTILLSLIRCDRSIDAATEALRRAGAFMGANSTAAFLFARDFTPLIPDLCAGPPILCADVESARREWQRARTPVRVTCSATHERSDLAPSILVHGYRDLRGFTSLFCFLMEGELERHSMFAQLIAAHVHDLLIGLLRIGKSESPALSPAERNIITHLLCGKSNKQIAFALGKSESTIRNQLRRLFEKLGVTRRIEAIRTLEQLTIGETA